MPPRPTIIITGINEARAGAASLPYPVVLKPRSSEEVSASGNVTATGAPLYARDADEFLAAFEAISRRCAAVLVQEFIEGEGAGYFALMNEGELRVEFAHRRIVAFTFDLGVIFGGVPNSKSVRTVSRVWSVKSVSGSKLT